MPEEAKRGLSIRLENIVLPLDKKSMGPFSLSLDPGDVCEIQSTASDRVRLFLRFLATFQKPLSGRYLLDGEALDFSAYQALLPVKRRIAYISTETTLITNRSLQENILMGQAWHQNTMHPKMDERCLALCRFFCIDDKLHLRPAAISTMGRRAAIVVRGLAKQPDLILVERPEEFVGKNRKEVFLRTLKECSREGVTLVFWTDDENLGRGWRTRKWVLEEDFLQVYPLDEKE
ncbi:hypothetical protein [Desulfobotulus sp.]|jgi:ABC-type lipoprotein export system ATPase subunit|uniref:hypothetical protein n=1 Tax=Desulfobotulus sp. TaxID=1940337 RepID=UPI002A36BD36|nr:hypothetical protein [Desulfobotulus sp.]MDY0163228.1 hypothetical protein [Desulfobotulus sp.]